MEILIGKTYKLESDSRQWTLFKLLVNEKTNEPYWYPITFHSTLPDALKSLGDRYIRGKAGSTLQDAINAYKEYLELVFKGLDVSDYPKLKEYIRVKDTEAGTAKQQN